ncbi:clasp N terminal-domain-containing protein [Lactarius psammicola]|nr:clasp N terminal-domain-containing protein [Lactarius psammicola]
MAPKAKIPSIIKCHSESALSGELELARDPLSLVETEETWDTIANALLRITALLNGGASEYPTTLTSFIRSVYRPITSAATSERSRLSAAAIECISTLATELGPSFDPLVPLFVPTLLSICSRPNKVFISRAKAALHTIIDQTQLISLLPYFVDPLRDKSVTLRLIAIESVLACVRSFNPPDLEKDARAKDVENAIKLTATDASADVRRVSRSVFDAYKILLPARVESFEAPLTPTMKKYLNIAGPPANSRPPSSQSTRTVPTTRPASSMSSAPPKREEPYPRPATSLAHHRSASSSTLAPNAPSKMTRSRTEGTIAPSDAPSVPGPLSKRKDDMPPPAIIPHLRPQGSEPTAPPERPGPPVVRQETHGPERPERPAEVPSSRSTTTQVQRPDPRKRPAHVPNPLAGPLRAEPTSIRERLLGRGQRVPLPGPKPQPQPAPPSRPLPAQEKQVMVGAPVVPKRSRVDSVRHGPKASVAIAAKRAVTQVAASPVSVQSIAEKKERPTEGKKVDSKPPPTAGTGERRKFQELALQSPTAPSHPRPTRSTSKAGLEPRAQKKEEPKAGRPAVATSEKKEKPSQSSKSAATAPVIPPKKVVARTGGVTQPTLSQLARIKAGEEEKGRRADAKGTTKPLTIRRKGKAVLPKVAPNETEIPAAATMTPLPPSPEVRPADVPLPESPVSVPLAVQEEQAVVPSRNDTEGAAVLVEEHPPTPTPVQVHASHPFGVVATAKTPISALVHSINVDFCSLQIHHCLQHSPTQNGSTQRGLGRLASC